MPCLSMLEKRRGIQGKKYSESEFSLGGHTLKLELVPVETLPITKEKSTAHFYWGLVKYIHHLLT